MAIGVFAFAVGVDRSLGTTVGTVLLVIFGLGMAVAGVFVPDAVRGYPPGAPIQPSAKPTWQHQVHGVVGGPVAFLALLGACLTLAGQLQGFWRWYTVLTAIAGLGMTMWTALAYQRDAAHTGLIQRGLIAVYWSWIVFLESTSSCSLPNPEPGYLGSALVIPSTITERPNAAIRALIPMCVRSGVAWHGGLTQRIHKS